MKNMSAVFRSIAPVLFLFLTVHFTFGQGPEWISNLGIARSALSQEQQQKLQKLEGREHFKDIQYVRLGSLPNIQKKGTLTFSVPGYPHRLVAESSRVSAQTDIDYKWSGSFRDRVGNITIVSKNGEVRGHIAVDDQVFEIYPLDDGTHALVTLDTEILNQQVCATVESSEDGAKEKDSSNILGREGACANPVQALVFFTPAADAADPNIELTADLAIDQFNTALINSSASSSSWIILVGTEEYNIVEDPNINEDLDDFAADPNVQALRDQFNADLMILLTDGDYANNGIGGLAQDIGPNDAAAYAIADLPFATSTYTLSHEAGHLFGAMHQVCADYFVGGCDNGNPVHAHGYSFAYGLFNQNKRRTMMHQFRDNYTRVLNFSNPDVTIGGKNTGTTAGHDNARLLDDNSPIVAQFQPSNDNLSVWVDGPTSVSSPGGRTYEAVYSCGQGPYTFQWAYSTDGFTYFNSGTSEFYTHYFYSNQNIYIRVTVNSNDGQQTNNVLFVNVNLPPGYRTANPDSIVSDFVELPTNIVLGDAYPNPSNSLTRINFALPETQNIDLQILDSNGRVVTSLVEGELKAGHYVKELNTGNLDHGLYFYRLNADNFTQTKKLILVE